MNRLPLRTRLTIVFAVAMAVGEFISGPLLDNPHRVGKPLTRELAAYHSARRGACSLARTAR